MNAEKSLCLIGGTGRSGTSILKKVFATHPHVLALPVVELRLLNDPDGLVDFYTSFKDNWSPYWADTKIRRLEKLLRTLGGATGVEKILLGVGRRLLRLGAFARNPNPYHSIQLRRFCPRYDKIVDQFIESLVDFRYQGTWNGSPFLALSNIRSGQWDADVLAESIRVFFDQLLQGIPGQEKASHYIDDDPFNILFFKVTSALFPDAKLVHMYRDPRDVVVSFMQQCWAPSELTQAIAWYRNIMATWQKTAPLLEKDTYLCVSLEKLADAPEEYLHEICSFWKLPWHPSLRTIPFNGANSGRWRTELSKKQQHELTDSLQAELAYWGYEE